MSCGRLDCAMNGCIASLGNCIEDEEGEDEMPKYTVTVTFEETSKRQGDFAVTADNADAAIEIARQSLARGYYTTQEIEFVHSEPQWIARREETVASLKEDLKLLGTALQNMLRDIENTRTPTLVDSQGIGAAIQEANMALEQLGFKSVPVAIRELYQATDGEAGTHVVWTCGSRKV